MPSPPPDKRPATVPRPLAEIIDGLPITPAARDFLGQMVLERAWIHTAELAAPTLGLRNKDALRDRLISLNLPRWGFLKRWFRHYALVSEAESGHSFAAIALADGRNPSTVYRSLKDALKIRSVEILARGGTALLESLLVAEVTKIQPRNAPEAIEESKRSR